MITEPTESLHTTATSSATDAPPGARLISLLFGKHVTHAISAVAGLGVADQRSDVPVPMETIAEAIAANVPALYRVMRTLAAVRVFAEDPNRSFSRTAMVQLLRQDAPGSVRYCAIQYGNAWSTRPFEVFTGTLRTGIDGVTLSYGKNASARRESWQSCLLPQDCV